MLKTVVAIFGTLFYSLKNRAVIFMYHSVGESKAFFSVHPEEFEKQLKYLKLSKAKVVTLNILVQKLVANTALDGEVVITFDDGYVDFKNVVLPLLEKYEIPATVFWIPGYAGKLYKTSDGIEVPVMTEEDVRYVSRSPYVSVMSHSMTHRDFGMLSGEEVVREIEEGRAVVERLTEKEASCFAYPKGRFTSNTIEAILKGNVLDAAVTVSPGYVTPQEGILTLPRISVDSRTNFRYFTLCVSGGAALFFLIKRWISSNS